MNALTKEPLIDEAALRREITSRDREIANPFTKDLQVTAVRGARAYLGDKLIRTATPHRILDPKAGPLIAVRLNILTRKSRVRYSFRLTGTLAERSSVNSLMNMPCLPGLFPGPDGVSRNGVFLTRGAHERRCIKSPAVVGGRGHLA
jgi:predicted oxidoreductase